MLLHRTCGKSSVQTEWKTTLLKSVYSINWFEPMRRYCLEYYGIVGTCKKCTGYSVAVD